MLLLSSPDCERATLRGVVQIHVFECKRMIHRFDSKQVHLGAAIYILLNQHLQPRSQQSCPKARPKISCLGSRLSHDDILVKPGAVCAYQASDQFPNRGSTQ